MIGVGWVYDRYMIGICLVHVGYRLRIGWACARYRMVYPRQILGMR